MTLVPGTSTGLCKKTNWRNFRNCVQKNSLMGFFLRGVLAPDGGNHMTQVRSEKGSGEKHSQGGGYIQKIIYHIVFEDAML